MDDEHQSDYLIQRLEEMFAKLEKRSQKTDAWEGEDEEGEEDRGQKKKRRQPKRPAIEKSPPNISETAKAGGLGDSEKDVEMFHIKEKNRFSFRNTCKTSTMAKDRKLKSEDEMKKIMNTALQRQDKIKRRRKRGTKNAKRSVSEKDAELDEASANQRLDILNVPRITEQSMEHMNERNRAMTAVHTQLLSTFNAEAFGIKIAHADKVKQKKEQMEAVHAELKAKHLSKKRVNLDGVRKYVSEIVEKTRQKLLKEETTFQFLQVQKSIRMKHEENVKRILDIRKAKEAVHEELLTLFTSGVRKPFIVYCEKAKAKREQMINVHKELKRQTFLKGLCIEDDDEDAGFVPRKLFLFGIEEFSKVQQVVLQPNIAQNNSVEVPSCSVEPVANQEEESEAPFSAKRRPSIGERFLRFLGFR
uniref:Uncharacterized protein n=2 Tax=Magallana gigas TaxID=29159 RepID=A0A8W8K0J0_MAGGI|nr:DEAD-box ATP-dependent RNA helicase 42-like [Crassostrea gigas]